MVNNSEEHIELLQAQLDLLREQNGGMTEIQRSLHGLVGVGAALKSIQSEVSKTFGDAQKFHTKALGQGTSIGDFSDKFSSNINQLSGNVTGYSSAIQTSFSMYSAGLRDNSKGLTTLAGFTKSTGGDLSALNNQLASSLAGAKLSDKQRDRLGEHTVELSQRFSITSNSLVGALKGLGAEVNNFKALGLLDESAEAGLRLAAALGPEMAGAGSELLSAFAGGSGMIKAEILGLGNERRAFLAGGAKSAQAGVNLILKAGKNAAAQVERFTKGAADPAFALSLATQVLGKEVVQAANVRAQLEMKRKQAGAKSVEAYVASTKQQGKISTEYTRTMSALKQQIMNPLQSVVFSIMEVVTALLNIPAVFALIKFLGQTGVILGILVIGITGLVVGISRAYTTTKALITKITDSLNSEKKSINKKQELIRSLKELGRAIKGRSRRMKGDKIGGKWNPNLQGGRGSYVYKAGHPGGKGGQAIPKNLTPKYPFGLFHKSTKESNRQRGVHTNKLAGAAGALMILSAAFGDQLPAWVDATINLAFGVTSLVAAVQMLGGGKLFSGLFSGMKDIFGKATGVGGNILGKITGRKRSTVTEDITRATGNTTTSAVNRGTTGAGGTTAAAGGTTPNAEPPRGASKLTKFVEVLKKVGRGIGDFIRSVGKGIGKAIKGILKGMAEGVKYMSKGKVLKGAKNMIVVGAAVVVLAYGLKTMVGVGISTIAVLAGALITTALAIRYFGNPLVLRGAGGLTAVGAAIGVLGLALKVIGDIPTDNLIKAGGAIVIFSAAAFALGAIIMTGAGGALFAVGLLGFAALGLALIPLGVAASIAAPGLYGLAEALKAVSGVSWKDLALVSAALPTLGVALAAFSAGGMVSGLFELGGVLSGGDSPIDTLKALAETAGPIVKLAAAITLLSKGMEQLAKVPAIDPNISKTLQLDGLSSGTPRSTGPSSSRPLTRGQQRAQELRDKWENGTPVPGDPSRRTLKPTHPQFAAAPASMGNGSVSNLKDIFGDPSDFTKAAQENMAQMSKNLSASYQTPLAQSGALDSLTLKQINASLAKLEAERGRVTHNLDQANTPGTRQSNVKGVHRERFREWKGEMAGYKEVLASIHDGTRQNKIKAFEGVKSGFRNSSMGQTHLKDNPHLGNQRQMQGHGGLMGIGKAKGTPFVPTSMGSGRVTRGIDFGGPLPKPIPAVDPVAANRGKFAPRGSIEPFNNTYSGEGLFGGQVTTDIGISQPTSTRQLFEDIQAARMDRDNPYTDEYGTPDASLIAVAEEQLAFSKSLFKVVQALETKMGYSIDQNMTNAAMQNLTAEEANLIAAGRPTSGPGGGRGREVGD